MSLVDARRALAGGESGAAIVPGKPDESLLIEYVSGSEPQMPKDAQALSADEVAALRRWVAAGASWPDGPALRDKRVIDTNWWSLLPLVRPAVPTAPARAVDAAWKGNPVDAFILARLARRGCVRLRRRIAAR